MNCSSCFHWKRNSDFYGECDNRQGVQIEPYRAKLLTREDFSCIAYSQKFKSTTGKIVSQKVEPQQPWDQGGDVNPIKVH